jgi:ABC-type multidrug transport system permease subunit
MAGLQAGVYNFLIFFFTVLLVHISSVTAATLSIACFRDFARASMIGNFLFGLSVFAGGCFSPPDKIPAYVRWIKWISYEVGIKLL